VPLREFALVHVGESSMSARQLLTFGPDQLTFTSYLPVGSSYNTTLAIAIIAQPKS